MRINMKSIFIVVLAIVSVSAPAKTPSSVWKSGVLKRVTKEHLSRESSQLGKKPPKHGVYINYYFIEADNSLYEGDDVKLKQNEKGFPVSVNSPVKFFVSGSDMYVQDDRGKKHRLRLVNVLPTDATQQSSASPQK
jgi:hypothetical protein